MSADELNFKKMSTEKYRVYRLLQSPSIMVETYRKRIKEIGSYRGAIIFPEQFISLYGQSMYHVQIKRTQDQITCAANAVRSFSLLGTGIDRALMSFDDVMEVERSNLGLDVNLLFSLRLRAPSAISSRPNNYDIDIKFDETAPVYWFSNKSDTMSYLRKNIVL